MKAFLFMEEYLFPLPKNTSLSCVLLAFPVTVSVRVGIRSVA